MANYTISYACGHGSTTKQLYGKHSERESYVAWAQSALVCPDCYRVQREMADAAAPMLATVVVDTMTLDPVLVVVVRGQISTHKDALVAAGYRWGEVPAGMLADWLSTKAAPKAYHRTIPVTDIERTSAELSAAQQALAAIGYSLTLDDSALDWEMLRRSIAARDARKAARPAKPAWYVALAPAGSWNRKVYGRAGSHSIYITPKDGEGVKHQLTDAQAAELVAYNTALLAWERTGR